MRAAGPRKPVEWAAIQARLTAASEATESLLTPRSEEVAQILADRARRLAKPLPRTETDGETLMLTRFVVGREQYAIESRYVQQVVPLQRLTRIPQSAPFIAGVGAVRGELVLVVDLANLLGIQQRAAAGLTRLIVLGDDERDLAVLANEASDVIEIPVAALRHVPANAARTGDFVRAVAPGPTFLLDAAALLRDPRLVIDQSSD